MTYYDNIISIALSSISEKSYFVSDIPTLLHSFRIKCICKISTSCFTSLDTGWRTKYHLVISLKPVEYRYCNCM